MRAQRRIRNGCEVWMRVRDGGRPVEKARSRIPGMSQYKLSVLVNRTDTTIWQIEKGRLRSISEQLAHSIARALDTDVDLLFEEVLTPARVATVRQDGGRAA